MGRASKILLGIVIVGLISLAGLWGWHFWFKEQKRVNIGLPILTKKIIWGAQLSNFPLNRPKEAFHPERLEAEMQLLKELGVTHFRANAEFTEDPDFKFLDQVNDTVVDLGQKYTLTPVLVLEAGKQFNEGDLNHSYQLAFERGYYIASRYKGKVEYYQMLNEVSGLTVWQEGDTGDSLTDPYGYQYNKSKYDRVKAWLGGFSDGIKKADPGARRIVTGHWLWYTVIDYLIQDKIQFEIIGWAWYSPEGTDITKMANTDDKINLALELKKFKKELWIIESNRDKGSYSSDGSGEREQADFIGQISKSVYDSGYFKGFFIYPLVDPTPEASPDPATRDWGFIKITKDSRGEYQFGEPKKAFQDLKDFIATH